MIHDKKEKIFSKSNNCPRRSSILFDIQYIYSIYQYITCDKLKETKKNIVINNFICNKL